MILISFTVFTYFVVFYLVRISIGSNVSTLTLSSSLNDHCSGGAKVKMAARAGIQDILNERYGPQACSCAASGRWKKVAQLDMSREDHVCPSNWTFVSTSVRACGRTTKSPACDSAIFSVGGFEYSKVCGKVLAYQRGTPDAFDCCTNSEARRSLEQPYVDGVSLTHGQVGSRRHIWTFAAAVYEQKYPNYVPRYNCACTNTNYKWPFEIPSFIGGNYFCDTGNPGPRASFIVTYCDDPLWDGQGCGPSNTCCELNRPPWFCVQLDEVSREDLEVRICSDQSSIEEDILVSYVEVYVGT